MAAELVGGALISASIQALIDKITSREVLDYLRAKKHCDFDGLLRGLKIRLYALTAVLDDAEQKQIRNRGVQAWLDELQEAVYDAEDLLGEIEYDAYKLAELGTTTSKVSNFFSTSRNSSDGEMERKMEKILKAISNHKHHFGVSFTPFWCKHHIKQ